MILKQPFVCLAFFCRFFCRFPQLELQDLQSVRNEPFKRPPLDKGIIWSAVRSFWLPHSLQNGCFFRCIIDLALHSSVLRATRGFLENTAFVIIFKLRMKLGETSSLNLTELCIQIGLPLKGIFLRDTLPHEKVTGFYIVNMDTITSKKKERGTHWVAFFSNRTHCVYMDPFGVAPPTGLWAYMEKHWGGGTRAFFNQWQIQDLKADSCGYWCIWFGSAMNGKSSLEHAFNHWLDQFEHNTKANEDALKRHFS